MVVTRRVWLALAGCMALVLALTSALALAGEDFGATSAVAAQIPPTSAPPTAQPPSGGSDGSDKTGTVQSCHIFGGPNGFGSVCVGGGLLPLTVAQILGADPVPDCWDDQLSPTELSQLGVPAEDLAANNYYWHTCLTGVDPTTKVESAAGLGFKQSLRSLPKQPAPTTCRSPLGPGQKQPCVQVLTVNQQQLIQIKGDSHQIPSPVAVASPATGLARVNQDVAFFDYTDTSVAAVDIDGVRVEAHMTSFTVYPAGENAPPLPCAAPWNIKAGAGDTRASKPGACWYTYRQSSGAQPDSQYQVKAVAHWVITVNGVVFNQFDKYAYNPLKVTQVQTVVVGS